MAQAQVTIQGQVLDKHDKAISFTRIGIMGTSEIGLSDLDGFFSMKIPKHLSNRKLTFLVPGYLTLSLPIDSLQSVQNLVIRLEEDIRQMTGTIVKAEKLKTRVKGNKGPVIGNWRMSLSSTYTSYAIAEKPPKKPSVLTDISFHVNNDSIMTFTVRPFVYAIKDNEVDYDKNLITENRILTFTAKNGWLTMDIKDLNVEVSDRIIFGVEWIAIEGDPTLLSSISITALGRHNSFQAVGIQKFEAYRQFVGGLAIKGTFEYY